MISAGPAQDERTYTAGMRSSWLLVLGATALLVGQAVVGGHVVFAVAYGALGLAIAYWLSPWRGGRSVTHTEVLGRPEVDRRVVIYWRPGCVFCARLRGRLGRLGRRATWVNIWQDPDAAAFVAGVNDGNQIVPTVVIDGVPLTNPDPERVRQVLAA